MLGYYDKRSEFWKKYFDQAESYDAYLAGSQEKHANNWASKAEEIPALDQTSVSRVKGHNRKLNVLMYSGVWCGDCVRQGPMLKNIADAIGEDVDLRIIDRDVSDELKDELRVVGAMRVPIVVFLSEDFWEIGRFGDRLLTVSRRKAERETGAACAVGFAPVPGEELKVEQEEWVDIFERMLIMLRTSPPLRERYGD